eukprot:2130492-Amphidinium_carterae.1
MAGLSPFRTDFKCIWMICFALVGGAILWCAFAFSGCAWFASMDAVGRTSTLSSPEHWSYETPEPPPKAPS